MEGIAVDPNLNRAVLASKDQDKAWILNLDSLQMVTSIAMVKNPGAVAIQTDTHIAVVASKDDDSLSLIDLTNSTATLNFSRIDKPTGLAISNRFNIVLVVSSDKNDLAIVQLPNVAATVSDISPSQVAAGAGATTLTINGARFVDGAVVYFGATALVTTWVSSSTLTAAVPVALLAAAGNINIRVQNPAPAGGTSESLVFSIVIPVPVLDGVGPATALADNIAKTFTLVGRNFYSPISVLVTGLGTAQTFAPIATSHTSAQVSFPAALFNVAGTLTIAVRTDGGTSRVRTINVIATAPPAPLIGTATAGFGSATVPFSAPLGNGGSTITSYIATSSSGNFFGNCVAPCTSIIVTGLATGVSYTFTVKANNANGLSPASAASNSVTPLATNLPTLTNVSPDTVLADNGAKLFTMSGSNFSLPMSLVVAGSAGMQTVNVNSTTSTTARVVLSETFFTTPGTLAFSVTTVAGTSNSSTVTVAPAAPTLMISAPATLVASSRAQMVTLIGTGFFATVKVRINGISIAVNPISAMRLDVASVNCVHVRSCGRPQHGKCGTDSAWRRYRSQGLLRYEKAGLHSDRLLNQNAFSAKGATHAPDFKSNCITHLDRRPGVKKCNPL